MNRYKLFKAGIDTNGGINRFNGNAEMYEKYLMRFPEDQNYSVLCKAIAEGDVTAAFAASHALKGVAGNLSLSGLYEKIVPLVEELRACSLDKAPEMLAKVTAEYDKVVAALAENG